MSNSNIIRFHFHIVRLEFHQAGRNHVHIKFLYFDQRCRYNFAFILNRDKRASQVKIGVISDTHLPGCDEKLKRIVDRYFHDVDMIIHAGDLVDIRVLDAFGDRQIRAVCGNMDNLSVRQRLPDRLILDIQGFHLGVMHGWETAENLEEKMYHLLGPVDCLIYGHTHCPVNRVKEGVLFFNPGSALDKRFTRENTLGILKLGDRITGEIIKIEIEKEQ